MISISLGPFPVPRFGARCGPRKCSSILSLGSDQDHQNLNIGSGRSGWTTLMLLCGYIVRLLHARILLTCLRGAYTPEHCLARARPKHSRPDSQKGVAVRFFLWLLLQARGRFLRCLQLVSCLTWASAMISLVVPNMSSRILLRVLLRSILRGSDTLHISQIEVPSRSACLD